MILVTGATGHLGSHLLYELTKSGKQVRAMYRDASKIEDVKRTFGYYQPDYQDLLNRINWFKGDINDYFALTDCMQDVSVVFHTAGLVSFNNKDKEIFNLVNNLGTANVVNACLENGVEKLCHVSSIAALGDSSNMELIDEKVIWNQGDAASAYSFSKYRGEMEVWRGINEGLNAVIVNPSVIIGPGMWVGPSRHLIVSLYKGLKFYPSGSSGYVDVRDVARSMILLTESNIAGERFIINAENIPHREYMNYIAKALGRPLPAYPIKAVYVKTAVITEWIRKIFTGFPPRINRKTFEIASENLAYSSNKIRNALGINFIPVKESVNTAMQLFVKEIEASF